MLYSALPREDRGGVQRVMETLEAALAERGLATVRLGPDERDSDRSVKFSAEASASAGGRPRLAAVPRAAATLARLAALIGRFRPDVVNVHFATGAMIYFIALRAVFRFRLVLSTHGSDVLLPPPTMRSHLPRFLRAADAVTVVSDAVAEAALAAAPEAASRLRMIPNGVDLDFWKPAPSPTRRPRIVAAGRLTEVKGFDLLIRALAGTPEAELTILGEGAERPRLEALAREQGVADRIAMPGLLPPEAVRDAFRSARVFAMPSRSEGLPLALLEALACGLPAVASRVGGLPSVVTPESGWLVPPEEPAALRHALAAALAKEGAASPEGARARATDFSLARSMSAYLDLFAQVSRRGAGV